MSSRAESRSRLFVLLARGFGYPTREFFTQVDDGAYGRAVGDAYRAAFGEGPTPSLHVGDFESWETEYATLFDVGRRGRPLISLSAGDHDDLIDGRERPQFLLEYVRWYSHFGLKTHREASSRELPDHLTCQLEFMAWLTHLEATAGDGEALRSGYRHAQFDFCQRLLRPFVDRISVAAEHEVARLGFAPFFPEIALVALRAVELVVRDAEPSGRTVGPRSSGLVDDSEIQDLWGEPM